MAADEAGIRHRFEVLTAQPLPTLPPGLGEELLGWCVRFDEAGLAPVEGGASAGNLSVRLRPGSDSFLITPSRSRLKAHLDPKALVEVRELDWQNFALTIAGQRPPSSDSFLHGAIYAARPDVHAILHGHDDQILSVAAQLAAQHPIAFTPEEVPFGTADDARECAEVLGAHDYLIRAGHGFVAVGPDLESAGELALARHGQATALARATDGPRSEPRS